MQVNGNTSGFPAQSWLAPRPRQLPGRPSRSTTVTAVLPHAVALSKLRFWNYFRNPERGVCELDVLLDDRLIYSGCLRKAAAKMDHQTVLFTNAPAELAVEKSHVKYCLPELQQDALTLIDEDTVKRRGQTFVQTRPSEAERPATALVS